MTIQVTPWDGTPITRDGFYSGVPMSAYHGPGLCGDDLVVGSSGLRTLFADSPMDFWVYSQCNPNRLEKPQTEGIVLGRAAHHLSLGQPQFEREFAIEPETYVNADRETKPWNNNATACRQWRAERERQGRTILSGKLAEHVIGICGGLPWQKGLADSGLLNNDLVAGGLLTGLIEHSLIWRDPITGIWLKTRPDAFPTNSRINADVKTTSSVEFTSVERSIADYRYDMQAALAYEGAKHVLGIEIENFSFVFVCSKPPYAVRLVEMRPSGLKDALSDLRVAIDYTARCWERKRWPGPGGTISDAVFVSMPKWARERADNRRFFIRDDIDALKETAK